MSWIDLARLVLVDLDWVILVYFLLVNSFYGLQLVSAMWEMRQHILRTRGENHWRVLSSEVAPSISMLAPAYNEAATIAESVRGFFALQYSNLEVVVVNDGSRDDTMDVLKKEFGLVPIHTIYWRRIETRPIRALYRSARYPNLVVVDKENGGKADALNAGLNIATGELVCAMDADTLIESDALQRIVRPFLMGNDVLAAGGTIRIANGSVVRAGRVVECRVPRRPLAGFQVVEYLRAFLFGRLGLNRLGGNLIISGAFGLFRRDALIATGGYARDTVGEDMELVLRLRRHGYETGGPHRVDFIPDPVAWTEAPETARILGRQRDRWHRGLADVLWRHRGLLFNPRYGAMGMLIFPYYFVVELIAPVVEALGLIGLAVGLIAGAVNLPFAFLFFLCAYGYAMTLTTGTLLGEEINYHRYEGVRNRLFLILWALLESLGYRQMTVYWRLRGLIKYLRRKSDWGMMERRGFRKAVSVGGIQLETERVPRPGARPLQPGNTRPTDTPVLPPGRTD